MQGVPLAVSLLHSLDLGCLSKLEVRHLPLGMIGLARALEDFWDFG
jgi:hypothetical protein